MTQEANVVRDAARYAFIRANYTQSHSLHMDGTAEFHLRTIFGRAGTFDKLVDMKIAESKGEQCTESG